MVKSLFYLTLVTFKIKGSGTVTAGEAVTLECCHAADAILPIAVQFDQHTTIAVQGISSL